MLDINLIRQKPEWVAAQLAKRGTEVDFAQVLKLDAQKRKLQTETEALKARRNKVSAEVAVLKKQGSPTDAIIAEMKTLGDKIAANDKKLGKLEAQTFNFLAALPNIPADEVVAGGKENNKVIKTFGTKPNFTFKPKDHVELCTKLGLIDYERAARMSGARTWIYTGLGAMLEWALLNYFIDFHVANGYTLIMPPHLLNYESGYAAGQFPKFQEDVFCTTIDDGEQTADAARAKFRFFIPTAETALINMHRGEIIPPEKLPIKYAGYSTCYRNATAGYGSKERGMIRGYQFNKIEMFSFCKADESPQIFKEFVRNAEKLVEGLGLHYQTVALAAGDVGASMAITYDIEVFVPSFGYKEVSSASNAMDYQARRAGIRTRTAEGNALVHTLNASGLATSRIIPAIVEQFQNADGSVTLPTALHKYMHGITVLK